MTAGRADGGARTTALVLAGGGVTGIAWESGVLVGLAAAGIDFSAVDLILGTSAGAYVGARLVADGSPDPLFGLETSGNDSEEEDGLRVLFGSGFVRAMRWSRLPWLGWLAPAWIATLIATTLVRHAARHGLRATVGIVDTLALHRTSATPQAISAAMGAVANLKRRHATAMIEHWEKTLGRDAPWPHAPLVVTAIDTADGSPILFDAASGVPFAAAVAASSCLPALVAPIELLGRRFMDGGIVSPANAAAASSCEEIWIICPSSSASLDREVDQLRRGDAIVHLVQPSAAARRSMPGGMGELDPTNRLATARSGVADGRAAASRERGPSAGAGTS